MEAFQKFYVELQMYFPIGFNRISNYTNVTKSINICKITIPNMYRYDTK